MKTIGVLLLGIAIGIVMFGIVGMAFLMPAPVNTLHVYCQGAVDLWLLQQGADPFDPKVAELVPDFDTGCMEDVMSGEFAGRASVIDG